jgi:uncharacterized protein (UPF0332 family)
MKPVDFLAFSLKVLKADTSPAALFSAISRAYYAAFHAAREFLEEMNISGLSKGPGAHGNAPKLLVQTGDSAIDQAGLDLANLHGERISADYRLDLSHIESLKVAAELVNQASGIIAALKKCSDDARRYATVTSAVRQRSLQLQGLS